MGMKFTLNTVKKPAAPAAVKKAFNMAAAEEALLDSYDRFAAAYDTLLATEGVSEKIIKVFNDSTTARNAIAKKGCTAQVMAIFNGKNHNLDNGLGLESLDIAALEEMTAASKKLLQNQYLAALEGNIGEAARMFAEKVKTWFAQFVEWMKELFTGNAKLLRMVTECNFENLDPEAEIHALPYANAQKIAEALEKAGQTIKAQNEGKPEAEFTGMDSELNDLLKPETKKVAELGWTAQNAKEMASKFANFANNTDVKAALQKTREQSNEALKESAAGTFEKAKEKFAGLQARRAALHAHTKLTRALGVTLLRLAKKKAEAKTEETPAEPGAAPEAK